MNRPGRLGIGMSRGFTIVELMVVVAIAAILIVVAAPSFAEFLAKRRVEGAMAELVTDVQFARSEAISRNARVRMSFGTGCYAIHLATASATASTCAINPAAAQIKTVQIDTTRLFLKPVSSVTHFEFDPVRGTASNDSSPAGNGRVEVCIRNPGGTDCGTAATDWRLAAVLTVMGRVETCSPSGAGHVSGYSSSCS